MTFRCVEVVKGPKSGKGHRLEPMLRSEGAVDDDAGLGFGDGPQGFPWRCSRWGTWTRIWRGLVTVTRTLARRLRFLVRGALCVVLMAVVEWRVGVMEESGGGLGEGGMLSGLETPAQPFDSFGSDAGLDPNVVVVFPGAQGEVARLRCSAWGWRCPPSRKRMR